MLDIFEYRNETYELAQILTFSISEYCEFFKPAFDSYTDIIKDQIFIKFRPDVNVRYEIGQPILPQSGDMYIGWDQFLSLIDELETIRIDNKLHVKNRCVETVAELAAEYNEYNTLKPFSPKTNHPKISLKSNTIYDGTVEVPTNYCSLNCIIF